MMVTDAVVLSKLVDGTVIVARTAQTAMAPLRDTVRQIRDIGGEILGGVLNDMDVGRRGYYRYYRYGRYRYGYGRDTYYGPPNDAKEEEAPG
jgi:Mrp family chromosome partitioning ATPase